MSIGCRRACIATTCFLIAQSSEAAPPRAASLPRSVLSHLESWDRKCRALGGLPTGHLKAVQAVDLTGDGRLDYVVNAGTYNCRRAEAFLYGGHEGLPLAIYVGGDHGAATLKYDTDSHGVRIDPHESWHSISLKVAALRCGQPKKPWRPVGEWWYCWRELRWNEQRRKFVFVPIRQAKRVH